MTFKNADSDAVSNYFALDLDLEKIYEKITKDSRIRQAVTTLKGLRVIRQEPWECLVSYICATCKNIPAIKHMLQNLAQTFGQKKTIDDAAVFIFPNPNDLASASIQQLETCGLGYRAKYVQETAKTILNDGFSLERLKSISYLDAKKEIMFLPGVGQKVADCILLFSLEKHEAFPVDVWVKRALLHHYSKQLNKDITKRLIRRRELSDSDYRRLNDFGRDYFGEYAGYAQEYLYYHERTSKTCQNG